MLASASADGVLIFWDVQRGRRHVQERHRVGAHTQEVYCVAWSPDDSLLATCSADHVVKLWDPETGQCTCELSHHSKEVEAVAWLPDGGSLHVPALKLRVLSRTSSFQETDVCAIGCQASLASSCMPPLVLFGCSCVRVGAFACLFMCSLWHFHHC